MKKENMTHLQSKGCKSYDIEGAKFSEKHKQHFEHELHDSRESEPTRKHIQ